MKHLPERESSPEMKISIVLIILSSSQSVPVQQIFKKKKKCHDSQADLRLAVADLFQLEALEANFLDVENNNNHV